MPLSLITVKWGRPVLTPPLLYPQVTRLPNHLTLIRTVPRRPPNHRTTPQQPPIRMVPPQDLPTTLQLLTHMAPHPDLLIMRPSPPTTPLNPPITPQPLIPMAPPLDHLTMHPLRLMVLIGLMMREISTTLMDLENGMGLVIIMEIIMEITMEITMETTRRQATIMETITVTITETITETIMETIRRVIGQAEQRNVTVFQLTNAQPAASCQPQASKTTVPLSTLEPCPAALTLTPFLGRMIHWI